MVEEELEGGGVQVPVGGVQLYGVQSARLHASELVDLDHGTVCSRRSDPFYTVTCYING